MTKREYYLRLSRLFLGYKRKKTGLRYLPIRLWVELTSHCNLKCEMCPNKELEREEKGYMDFGVFRKIVDEASSFAYEVHLYHRGESLIHPEISVMTEYAHKAGLFTKLHTNATLLDEGRSRALIQSGLDHLSFSFDGYDKSTYEKIRVNADFEKTTRNILRFLEIKRELGSRKPYTVFEIINFPDLYKTVSPEVKKEFIVRFRGLPLDKLEVKEMHNWAGEIGGPGRGKKYSPCTFLWASLIILWDGAVLPCTQDFHGYLNLGNVREKSLAGIWNGDRLASLREKALRGDISDLETCSRCDRVWRKQFLGVPKEYLWKLLLRRMP
ncbi:MAG: radical SAM protein [Acidobacteriota bacterium]|nr:radical SAM protein [Acidobacteriota bacterium]